jgi:zinc/manganese transport system substrate-binding protein
MGILKLVSGLLFFLSAGAFAQMKVASLHPLLSDIAKNVGGDKVMVINLLDGAELHSFSPSASTLKKSQGAKIFLAAGKGLETYLPKLKELVGEEAHFLEVGKDILSIVVSKESAVFQCCPGQAHGSLDPHWWHSLPNIRKAAQIVGAEFSKLDPDNAAYYKKNVTTYRYKMDQLDSWVKSEVSKIPKEKRYLATAHAAFAYFCQEYEFKAIPVQGLNEEQDVSAKYLATVNEQITKNQVGAIFSEMTNNPKELKAITEATGARLGGKLYADSCESVELMFKHNVSTIVEGLVGDK